MEKEMKTKMGLYQSKSACTNGQRFKAQYTSRIYHSVNLVFFSVLFVGKPQNCKLAEIFLDDCHRMCCNACESEHSKLSR